MVVFLLCLVALALLIDVDNPHPLAKGVTIDHIKIIKSQRQLDVYHDGNLLKRYKIALGRNPVGNKERQGDKKTPEGIYQIILKNAQSSYHLSLKISYPNKTQMAQAKALGIDPGSDIMIHGIRNGLGLIGNYHHLLDWTQGCIALTNQEIEEIYDAVSVGTTVEIVP